MAYIGKTNWQTNEIVNAPDMNRIEQGITNNDGAISGHISDKNNPHEVSLSDLGGATSNHIHGNITNDGKIGGTKDLPIFTDTAGVLNTQTVAGARNILGLGNTSGALPVANGGTGVTSMVGADYTTIRPRGISFANTEPVSVSNGCIIAVYE